MQADVTKVSNAADVEYEYTLGDRVFRSTRIGIGDIAGGRLEQTLNHYSVGATVPVYYDPKNPESALLERDPPVPVGWLYTIAAAIFLGGLVVLAVFWNISAIFEGLSAYFPEKAFLPGMAFFTLGGLMLVAMLWMARRQVAEASGWPAIGGRIVWRHLEVSADDQRALGAGRGRATARLAHRGGGTLPFTLAHTLADEGHDLLRAGGRIFISSERPRVPQHAGELWRQVGVLAGHRRSGCIALSHGQPGACALRSEEPLERRA